MAPQPLQRRPPISPRAQGLPCDGAAGDQSQPDTHHANTCTFRQPGAGLRAEPLWHAVNQPQTTSTVRNRSSSPRALGHQDVADLHHRRRLQRPHRQALTATKSSTGRRIDLRAQHRAARHHQPRVDKRVTTPVTPWQIRSANPRQLNRRAHQSGRPIGWRHQNHTPAGHTRCTARAARRDHTRMTH